MTGSGGGWLRLKSKNHSTNARPMKPNNSVNPIQMVRGGRDEFSVITSGDYAPKQVRRKPSHAAAVQCGNDFCRRADARRQPGIMSSRCRATRGLNTGMTRSEEH